MFVCQFCSRECKNSNSLSNHTRLCKNNPNRQEHPRGNKGKKGGNRFTKAAKLGMETPVLSAESIAKSIQTKRQNGTLARSTETRTKLSIAACNRLSKNSKYSKNIEYNGVILESSYELLFAQQMDSNGVEWKKCYGTWFDYVAQDGAIRRYVPDFYIPSLNVYIDTKNDYLITKDAYKIAAVRESHPITLLVYSLDDIVNNRFKQDFPTVAQGEQGAL